MTKISNLKKTGFFRVNIRYSNFEHCLGFRASDLEFLFLCSFKEIDPVPLFQGDDRFFPVGSLPVLSAQPFHLA
jgi:hypothetical protein